MMNYKHWIYFFFSANILFSSINIHAQTIQISDSISWKEPIKTTVSKEHSFTSIYFKGAIFPQANSILPYFSKRQSITNGNTIDEIKIIDIRSIPISNYELEIINRENAAPSIDSLTINAQIFNERNKPVITIGFYPIIKNKETNAIEKVISFNIQIKLKQTHASKVRRYATNSVLSSGTWRKISTTTEGIYIIGKQNIVDMGLDPSTTDPASAAIFGNGGAPIPENNSTHRNDDIQECAISVIGGGDGHFDDHDYILFYARSPIDWGYNPNNQQFTYKKNNYSNQAYYFITFDIGIGQKKRVQTPPPLSGPATKNVTSYQRLFAHEIELVNLAKSGCDWLGETFDITTSYSFPFQIPNLNLTKPLQLNVSVASSASSPANFSINIGGAGQTATTDATNQSQVKASIKYQEFNFTPSSTNFNVNITYSKPNTLAVGYLNYFTIIAPCNLDQTESQLIFRNTNSINNSDILAYSIKNGASSKIWDISDLNNIKEIPASIDGTTLTFLGRSDSAYQYCSFNGQSYHSPSYVGLVENQNLHNLSPVNMIIISHPDFLTEANRLKKFHKNERGLNVEVVTPNQIYNEFGSGSPDRGAIRDFAKMCYDKFGSNTFKYLLLFGDASYDYQNVLGLGGNFIPTYESAISTDDYSSFASDDFYAILDDNEGENCTGLLDIGVGRFIANSQIQAREMVDKTIRYCSKRDLTRNESNTISNFGDWKSSVTIIGDDQDGNIHLSSAEKLALIVEQNYPLFNVDKIFFDAYPQVSNSGGQRYPDVETAINERMRKGTILMNYIGHGGELGWAHERVLRISDITSWENKYNMPIMFTATCEFTRYDDPERISAGELVFMNANGGAAAMLTTSRVAWSSTNEYLCINFYNNAFERLSNNEYYALGDLMRISKNMDPGGWANLRNFVLIGDPSIPFAFPKHTVKTTMFNNSQAKENISAHTPQTVGNSLISKTDDTIKTNQDTLKALSLNSINGIITDHQNQKLNNFNGEVSVTIFDKPSTIQTLGNDPDSPPTTFTYQKNIIFKGKAKVTNGDFKITFIVPKDINYSYGSGKISFYAKCDTADASGYFSNFIVGGYSDKAIVDNTPPEIKLYLNDENFANQGMTNENPVFIAEVVDSSGINIMGSAIGHDAVITLDKETEKAIVVNDYFETELNSYQKGFFKYPLKDLSEGKHSLTFKVWDILNNSSEKTIEFSVVREADLALSHVLNYPNPFSTHTSFFFEHNQAESMMDVRIQVMTISGKLIKTISQSTQFNGFRSEAIEWDGTDEFGDKLAKGIYLYKLSARTATGKYAEKIEKLVIL